MENLIIKNNELFGDVRFVEQQNKLFAVANDVARALGYSNPSKATQDHCKHGVLIWGNDSLGRQQQFKIIPEGDIYRLIVKSRLPQAERFETWVFEDVLPTIRSKGSYGVAPIDILSPEMQAVHSMILEMARQKQETLVAIEQTQQAVKEVGHEVQQVLRPVVESFSRKENWRKTSNRMINGMAERTGKEHRALRHELYNRLEERAKVRLGVRLNNLKMRLHREGIKPSVINALNVLDVIEQDVQLQHIFLQVVQELHLELCVA